MTAIWDAGDYVLNLTDNKFYITKDQKRVLTYNDDTGKWFGKNPYTGQLILIDWPGLRSIMKKYDEIISKDAPKPEMIDTNDTEYESEE